MPALPEYEVYAIRYAMRPAQRRDHFLFGDPHEGDMPMDYFVWAAIGPDRSFVIDTGFTAEVAADRKRTFLRCPIDSLKLIGLDADEIDEVILTHLHYDHVGNFHRFPKARFHLQEPEIHFAVGRHMKHDFFQHPFHIEDVVGVVRLNYDKRVNFLNGPAEIAPGIAVHPVGGHSVGLQFVTVNTRIGTLVLASDATHFYENLHSRRAFPAVISTPDLYDGYDKLEAVAPTPDHIIPGHDPLVMQRFPAPSPELEGIVARLDAPAAPMP